MTVTAMQVQAQIVDMVGDTDDGLVASYISTIWAKYADKAYVAPRLQELYTRREAIDLLESQARKLVDQSADGLTSHTSQHLGNLLAMRKDVQAEITLLETRAATSSTSVFGALSNTAPIPAPTSPRPFGPPDGNDPAYSGTLYQPLRRLS